MHTYPGTEAKITHLVYERFREVVSLMLMVTVPVICTDKTQSPKQAAVVL